MTSGGSVLEFERGVHAQSVLWIAEFNDPEIVIITFAVLSEATNFLLICDRRTNFVGVEIFLCSIVRKNQNIIVHDGTSSLVFDYPPVVIIMSIEAGDFLLL